MGNVPSSRKRPMITTNPKTVSVAGHKGTVVTERSATIRVTWLQGTVENMVEPSKSNEGIGLGTLIGKGLVTSAKEFGVRKTTVVNKEAFLKQYNVSSLTTYIKGVAKGKS